MNLLPCLLALVMLPHGRAYVRECREQPGGCEQYVAELAHAIEGASIAHGVDPRMLAAIGYEESSLVGRSNAVSAGVFGWHRRSKLWSEISRRCPERQRGSAVNRLRKLRGFESLTSHQCLDDQADRTAAHLLELYRTCGSWDGALSAYQSGNCSSDSGVRYAVRVMRRAGAL